jgi:hypothetical protein
VVAKVADELMNCLAGEIQAAPSASAAAPTPDRLLTTDEVVAARPGLTRAWLYANKADCAAIQKNSSRRSPLWFRLADVDAELDRRRKKSVRQTAEAPTASPRSRRRQHRSTTSGELTANGAPRSFDVRPRRVS